jgi:aldose 1-epimerase
MNSDEGGVPGVGGSDGAVTLRSGRASAVIEPTFGGRLGQLTVDGSPWLRARDETPDGTWPWWGSYPLLPWSNRIPAGRFTFEGEEHEVEVNWSDGTAIHGLAAETAWTVDAATATPTRVELSVEVSGGPYVAAGRQVFELSDTALRQTLAVENRADRRLPFGLGIHPWFHAGAIRVPADEVWPAVDALPTGPPRPVAPDEDLRTRTDRPPFLDHCFTGLTGTAADVPAGALSWSGPITQVVVYTQAEGWVCVEPVTMANDGFRLLADGVEGHGVVALDPGEQLEVGYTFTWS